MIIDVKSLSYTLIMKQALAFFIVSHFHPSLILTDNSRCQPLEGNLVKSSTALLANVRLASKWQIVANTPPFYDPDLARNNIVLEYSPPCC
jgi:hypothetical protein